MKMKTENFLWIALAVLLLVIAGFALRVSPEDVAKCVEANGWTEARCEWELQR